MASRLVFFSDTHQMHESIEEVPAGDCLIHCGDFTNRGSLLAVQQFAAWFGAQPHRHKVAIGGNHDLCFEDGILHTKAREILATQGITYLQDSGMEIQGLKFWGSPWTPPFYNWAFMREEGGLARHWRMIPGDVDVLITHGPAWNILDPDAMGVPAGSITLRERVQSLPQLKVHAFGHLHGGHGQKEVEREGLPSYMAVNAAICTDSYSPSNKPIVVEI
jgi:Icc-related predicted phosphoesterase